MVFKAGFTVLKFVNSKDGLCIHKGRDTTAYKILYIHMYIRTYMSTDVYCMHCFKSGCQLVCVLLHSLYVCHKASQSLS